LLLAAAPTAAAVPPAAPTPVGTFVAGINGLPRVDGSQLDDARAAGFTAVRVFLHWNEIETREGDPDWTCRYLTDADMGPDADGDGHRDPWTGIPCDGTPCGCGFSADERVDLAAGAVDPLPVMLTLIGTPAWARGRATIDCSSPPPGPALPLRHDKTAAFRDFAAKVALRYGSRAYAFELWNEPDLAACRTWAGTPQQYREQILAAAAAIKRTGVAPGLVVAPTLEEPSGRTMDAWIDWSAPIDRVSFNLYMLDVPSALAKLEEMNAWCRARRRCPGFYVSEVGARRADVRSCPGPRADSPGAADVDIMRRCRNRRSCAGLFLYTLSDATDRPECDRGLFDRAGCRKRRLCTIARRFFHRTVPYACVGCGP
jgi:hypothetical protein